MDTDIRTITLEPSEELTRKMGEGNEVPPDDIKRMMPVVDGNPGAMMMLMEIRKALLPDELGFKCLLSCLELNKITGSKFYAYVKQQGGIEPAIEKLREAGWC